MSTTKNIKRNKLDYILTDLMPFELSELYSNRNFYSFLLNNKDIKNILVELRDQKKNNKKSYSSHWNSTPLKYDIKKKNGEPREISLLNPMALILVYSFINNYEKELLNSLNDPINNAYSLRCHKNENNLHYKKANRFMVEYYKKISKKLDKGNIEQTGLYYKIGNYRALHRFTNSKLWFSLNKKFKWFARLDYQECFSSIYTHSFKWLDISNDVDSKKFKNTSLLNAIDNVLQKTNSGVTNGIIVGPEFSRMMAEILLQGIDKKVLLSLNDLGYKINNDYFIGRYVDDVFIFTNKEDVLDRIVELYKSNSGLFNLKTNEKKEIKQYLPYVPNTWFNDANLFVDTIKGFFNKDLKKESYYTGIGKNLYSLKHQVEIILDKFDMHQKDTVISYWLSVFFNKLSPEKNKKIFKEGIKKSSILGLMDIVFFIYSKSINYANTQKMISITTFILNETEINERKAILNKIIKDNIYIFNESLNDIINIFPLLYEYKIELPSSIEVDILRRVIKSDNPILLANYLHYSNYNEEYRGEVLKEIEPIILGKINFLSNEEKDFYKFKESWFYFIFYNCPYLDSSIITNIKHKINKLSNTSEISEIAQDANKLICDFIKKDSKGFFLWDLRWRFSEQITYRTYQNTVFKNSNKKFIMYDYSSL